MYAFYACASFMRFVHAYHGFYIFRLLMIGGFAYVSGFCVTYYAGLAMIYQDWYIKRHPQKFMPKDPSKRQEKSREEARKQELRKHAARHLRLVQERSRIMKVGEPRKPLQKSVLVQNYYKKLRALRGMA